VTDAWEPDEDGDLPPFAALLVALADMETAEATAADDGAELQEAGVSVTGAAALGAPVTIAKIAIDLPIELAVREADAVVASTPSQHVETTVLPAFHRLRLTLEREHDA
jgi:hypothetical protein